MANKAISSLAVGSSVYLNVGGTRTEFLVVHQGLPSSLYDSSCDGTWLLMKDCYESRAWHSSNSNSYKASTIHTYLNGTFLGLFDSNIQEAIKQVKIPYVNGTGDSAVASGANGLSCKAFLLSTIEIGTPFITGRPNDGAKLDYFNSIAGADEKRIATLNGTNFNWWLRSPYTTKTTTVWYIISNGSTGSYTPSNSYGIRPCIILPSTTLVDDSGNVVTVDLTAHKALVNGTAYTVQGGKCMVDGTVYNILKGRTLIDGTGWDIAFPEPLVMPVKGDLITMNLDGTDRLYRVLKVVDGTTVEVLGMWDTTGNVKFNNSDTSEYSGGTLDTYLNTTWYNTLSSAAKDAIVAKNIKQYQYSYNRSVYNANSHASYADYSTKSEKTNVGDRYVYAPDIEDIEMYFGGTGGSASNNTAGAFSSADLQKMFWDRTSSISTYPWFRSNVTDGNSAWYIYGLSGYINFNSVRNSYSPRPAFQIDLSKIDFTIN